LQNTLHPLAADLHEVFQACLALLVAGSLVRRGITTKPKCFLIDDEINVLGKTLDDLPCLRQRGAALECEMVANGGQGEEFAQGLADPEVLFDADRL